MKRPDLSARNRTHGCYGTPEYKSWRHMMRRCYDKRDVRFSTHGARGIRVCKRWKTFANFLSDMGKKPSPKHTIDRFPNNNGNYEPGNCRWATATQQANNTRKSIRLTVAGVTKTLAEWARTSSVKYKTIWYRLRAGWSHAEAIT